MRNTRKVFIIALALIIIGGIGAVASMSALEMEDFYDSQVVNATHIDTLTVKLLHGKLDLRQSDTADIRVELRGKMRKKSDFRLEIVEKDGTLQIETTEPKRVLFTLFSGVEKIELTVHVPQKIFESIEATNSNGRIDVNGLQATKVKTTMVNGSIHLDHIASDNISFDLTNGDVMLARVSGDLSGSVVNGYIRGNLPSIDRNIDMTVKNGEIRLKSEQRPSSVIYDLRTTNGGITVFGSRDWDTVIGSGENKIKLRTTNGKISID